MSFPLFLLVLKSHNNLNNTYKMNSIIDTKTCNLNSAYTLDICLKSSKKKNPIFWLYLCRARTRAIIRRSSNQFSSNWLKLPLLPKPTVECGQLKVSHWPNKPQSPIRIHNLASVSQRAYPMDQTNQYFRRVERFGMAYNFSLLLSDHETLANYDFLLASEHKASSLPSDYIMISVNIIKSLRSLEGRLMLLAKL